MAPDLGLKQYIAARYRMMPEESITDCLKYIRDTLPKYRDMNYNSLYVKIQRVFKSGGKRKEYTTDNRNKARTPENIDKINKLVKRHKGTRKGSVRAIQKELKRKGTSISRGTVHNALKENLELKFRRKRKTCKLRDSHKI